MVGLAESVSITRMSLYFPESAARPARSRITVGRRNTIALDVGFLGRAEQPSKQWDVPKQRHLGIGAGDIVLNQAAKHDLAILGEDGALIARLLVTRSTAWAVRLALGAMEEISCSICRRRVAPSLMCGVTFSVTPISWRSMVVKGC